MANGRAYRFPKRNEDDSIEVQRLIKDKDGALKKVSELIFTADTPSIPINFTEEINNLISSGQIVIPSDNTNKHIVDISDQLESDKYTYHFISKSGTPVKCGDIYRIFFNGINVSKDVDLSADNMSFTFMDEYEGYVFGLPNTRIVIDFEEGA